jgi:hypothetical protein
VENKKLAKEVPIRVHFEKTEEISVIVQRCEEEPDGALKIELQLFAPPKE